MALAARVATRIMTVSESSKRDILRFVNTQPEKIDEAAERDRSRTDGIARDVIERRFDVEIAARATEKGQVWSDANPRPGGGVGVAAPAGGVAGASVGAGSIVAFPFTTTCNFALGTPGPGELIAAGAPTWRYKVCRLVLTFVDPGAGEISAAQFKKSGLGHSVDCTSNDATAPKELLTVTGVACGSPPS